MRNGVSSPASCRPPPCWGRSTTSQPIEIVTAIVISSASVCHRESPWSGCCCCHLCQSALTFESHRQQATHRHAEWRLRKHSLKDTGFFTRAMTLALLNLDAAVVEISRSSQLAFGSLLWG